MPEGDTVFRAARRLHEALAGHPVARFDLRVPQVATVDLTGEVVHAVVPRGKHILHRIGAWTLHSHLKMEGEWHVYRRGGRWRKPGYKARAIVGTTEWDTVGFDLADICVPMLLLHGRQDRFVPFAHSQWLATHIPGVEARLLDDDGHLTLQEHRISEVHSWLRQHL